MMWIQNVFNINISLFMTQNTNPNLTQDGSW
jgi:hypothetical protein